MCAWYETCAVTGRTKVLLTTFTWLLLLSLSCEGVGTTVRSFSEEDSLTCGKMRQRGRGLIIHISVWLIYWTTIFYFFLLFLIFQTLNSLLICFWLFVQFLVIISISIIRHLIIDTETQYIYSMQTRATVSTSHFLCDNSLSVELKFRFGSLRAYGGLLPSPRRLYFHAGLLVALCAWLAAC